MRLAVFNEVEPCAAHILWTTPDGTDATLCGRVYPGVLGAVQPPKDLHLCGVCEDAWRTPVADRPKYKDVKRSGRLDALVNASVADVVGDSPVQRLVKLYLSKIEGMVPDLADGLDDDENALRDSIYDYAVDYIYDRHADGATLDTIRAAARKIAAHFCGEEEA